MTDAAALRAVQERAARKVLTISAIKVTNKARELAPVDTGALRRALTYSITGSTLEAMSAKVGANVEHAIYVAKGTKAHIIRPRRAKALRFPGPGGIVFAKSVNHPGTKPNDYLVRALQVLRG